MYYLPVNVAVNFNQNRLISSFNPGTEEPAEFYLPLGNDVPVEVIVTACKIVSFPEKFISDKITTAKVLSSLINSYIFCKVSRANICEANESVIFDLEDALTRLYHHVDTKPKEDEWTVVKNKKEKWTVKKWIDHQITMKRDSGDIVRHVLPYAIFVKNGTVPFNKIKDDFEAQLTTWLMRIKDPQRVGNLSNMYREYLTYL